MKQGVSTRRTLLGQGINSFVWTLDNGATKFYHQQNNVTDTSAYTLVGNGVLYTEPKYSGFQAGVISGSFGMNVRGLGIMVLSANNTYTGTTIVEQGSTLQIGNRGATGFVAGGLLINSGSSVSFFRNDIALSYAGAISGSGTLNFNGTGLSGQSGYTFSGGNTFTGVININRGARFSGTPSLGTGQININPSGQLYISNQTVSNNLTISGDGWVEPSGPFGAIRYQGTSVISGNIALTNSAKIMSYNLASDTLTISGIISGNSLLTFDSKSGAAGTVTLIGINTNTGGYTVNLGTVVFSAGVFATGIIRGSLTVNSGGTANLRGSGVPGGGNYPLHSGDVVNINNGGTLVVSNALAQDSSCYFGTINLVNTGTACTVSTPDTSYLRVGHQRNSVLNSSGTVANNWSVPTILVNGNGYSFTVSNSNALNMSGIISDYTSLTGLAFNKSGTGTLTLSAVNTFAGATNITAGTLALSGSGSLASSSGINVSSGATFNTSAVTTSATIRSLSGAGSVTIGTKPLTLSANGTTTFSGAMSGSVPVTINSGTLTVTGSGKFGGWTVNSGATLTLNTGVFLSGAIGGTLTVNNGGLAVLDLTGGVSPTAPSDTIVVNGGGTVSYKGQVGYINNITLANTGGAAAVINTPDGLGGIQVGNGVAGNSFLLQSTGSGGIANTISCLIRLVNNGGGTVTFNPTTADIICSGVILDYPGLAGNTLTKTGSGKMTITSACTYSGPTVVNAGTLAITGSTTGGTTSVAAGAAISGGAATTGSVKALTFSALTSYYNVNVITTSSASKLICTTLTAASGFTINITGTMNAGTYPILVSTTGTPTPTLGTNSSGRTATFSWSGQTLNMILT